MSFYLSRAFVEFGPFPAAEILSFLKRGILQDTDYVRGETDSEWIHVNDWAAAQTTPAPAAEPVSTAAPAKKAAAKKAAPASIPAKKAAAKKAKK